MFCWISFENLKSLFFACMPVLRGKNWLSELVHQTCYRICARGLSATIHYHNKSVSLHSAKVKVHSEHFFSFPPHVFPLNLQREQASERRNMCCKSHHTHRCGHSGQRQLLRHGECLHQWQVSLVPGVLIRHRLQVGQIHGGLLGVLQRSMVRSCPHVWFERSEMKDRHAVTSRYGRVCH